MAQVNRAGGPARINPRRRHGSYIEVPNRAARSSHPDNRERLRADPVLHRRSLRARRCCESKGAAPSASPSSPAHHQERLSLTRRLSAGRLLLRACERGQPSPCRFNV